MVHSIKKDGIGARRRSTVCIVAQKVVDSLRNIVMTANKCRKKAESCIRLAEAVPCWGRRYSPRQFVATPPPNLSLLLTRFATSLWQLVSEPATMLCLATEWLWSVTTWITGCELTSKNTLRLVLIASSTKRFCSFFGYVCYSFGLVKGR